MEIKRVISPAGKNLQKAINDLKDNRAAKVGWFERSKYENGTPVATVAAVQEFGAPSKNIPPRAFIRPTIIRQQAAWEELVARETKAALDGKVTVGVILERLGLKAAGDIREAITKVFQPPLKPATIEARKRRRADKKTMGLLTKPLIDTGIMLNTLTNTVEDE